MVSAPPRSGASTTADTEAKWFCGCMRVVPDELVTAAQRLDIVQSDLGAANLTAAPSTTGITAAARDEISQNIAGLFSSFGQQFHAAVEQTGILGTQRFAHGLTSATSSYSSTEIANISSLLDQVFAPIIALTEALEVDPLGTVALLITAPVLLPILFAVILLLVAAYAFAVWHAEMLGQPTGIEMY